ncbi:MAG: hypothetical protein ACOH10_07770 [Rhodoglobus sp.]
MTTAPCSICGRPIGMRISEYKEMLALGAPIVHREHTTTAAEPILKSYRATVQVYEVSEDGTQELVAATTAKAHAASLHAAFNGPLSEDLQAKWLAMGERSALADLPGG